MPSERTRDEIAEDASPPTRALISVLDRLRAINEAHAEAVLLLEQELEQRIHHLAERMLADDQARSRLVHDAMVATSQGV